MIEANKIDLKDSMIDWHDRWGEGDGYGQMLINRAADIDRPCVSLGWCPYGTLKYEFPTSFAEAKLRELPTLGIPLKCGKGSYARHCPAFYLAGPRDPGVECESKQSESECTGCREGLRACPKGISWRRRVITRDNADPALDNWFPSRD